MLLPCVRWTVLEAHRRALGTCSCRTSCTGRNLIYKVGTTMIVLAQLQLSIPCDQQNIT